jgi:hypothetical protein
MGLGSMLAGKTVVAAVCALMLATPMLAEGLYAAIAFSQSSGQTGSAWNYETEMLAETEAYWQCGSEDCDTVVIFQQCGAIAVGDGYGMGFAADLSSAVAQDQALANCESQTTNCEITASFCNEGY